MEHLPSLCGKILTAVRYFDSAFAPAPAGNPVLRTIDSLDFGVELVLDATEIVGITWQNPPGFITLEVSSRPLAASVLHYRMWHGDETNARWRALINRPIVSARRFWSHALHHSTGEPVLCVHTLALQCRDSEPVYLVAGQYWEREEKILCPNDEIVVLFGEATAQRYQIGPFHPLNSPSPEEGMWSNRHH